MGKDIVDLRKLDLLRWAICHTSDRYIIRVGDEDVELEKLIDMKVGQASLIVKTTDGRVAQIDMGESKVIILKSYAEYDENEIELS